MKNIAKCVQLLLAIFSGNVILAQNSFLKIKKYYSLVNNAELSIIDSNYNNALKLYEQAFILKEPNGKDIYNAFLVSFYKKNKNMAKKYADLLAKKGMEKTFFEDTLSNVDLNNYVFKNYDRIFYKNKKLNHSNELDSISMKVRLVRNNNGSDTEIGNVDIDNLKFLNNFLMHNNIKKFTNFGLSTLGSNPIIEFNPIFLVLWHTRSIGFKSYRLNTDEEIINAVIKGILRPDLWGTIIMGRNMYGEVDTTYNYFMKIWNYAKLNSKEIEKYNKIRETVYLESLQDFKKKYDFQQIH